jgi:flagella basal body P-ring formation protein FlgA
MSLWRFPVAFLVCTAAAMAADTAPGCVAIEGERILAGDLARALPAFSTIAPDIELGYAPVPGVRRFFYTAELRRLALRYNVSLPAGAQACIERVMETLQPERVVTAMREALADADARIEILELSRFPIPRGDLEFPRSNLPYDTSAPVIWRGVVHYTGGRRFAVWASVKVRVRGTRIVATENLAAGQAIRSGQVKMEEYDVYPVMSGAGASITSVIGSTPRLPIQAGDSVATNMLDAPKDVERGDVVQVEVQSGATVLKLEGRAESAGRRGEPIKVHTLANGRSFSARIADKDRVVVNTALESKPKDANQ